ncbi:MAG: hypothetical protein Sapg2KO_36230 [Saprospiraceae bacterium]
MFMKNLYYLFYAFFTLSLSIVSSNAQTQEHKWLVFYSGAFQENDTRGFNFPMKNGQPLEYPSVSRHGVTISKKVLQHKKFNFYSGLGYARELNQLPRAFDHCFDTPGKGCTLFLIYLKDYSIDLIQVPLQGKFFLLKGLAITTDLIPEFSVRKIANKSTLNIRRTQAQFYSLSINPGLSYEHRRFSLGLSYRAFQLKTIDEVIFNGGQFFRENLQGKEVETFNPRQITLMAGLKI